MKGMKRKILYLIVITFLGAPSFQAFSQNDCATILEEAQSYYELGFFDSIPSILKNCMKEGFTNDELQRAYRLLILTYTFNDNQEEAKKTMLAFRDKFPEYELRPSDPVEFSNYYKSFETKPVYSIGVLFGGNLSEVTLLQPYSISSIDNYSPEYYSGLSYQINLQIKRYLTEKIELNLDLIYASANFGMDANIYDSNNQPLSRIEYYEYFSELRVPLSGTYDFELGNLIPFARAGIGLSYLLSSNASITRTYTDLSGLTDVTGPDIDKTVSRNQIDLYLLLGGGLKYKFSKGYLILDVRYNMGLMNRVDEENRYDELSDIEIYKFHYIDDDFKFNSLTFSLGYVFSIYKTFMK